MDGEKELLGMWCNVTEGAKFWLSVLTELKNRGVQDVLVCCCDGLTGFPDAIEAVYPQAKVQLCIVHLVRQSLRFVGWKERKAVAADLKQIYGSATLDEAEMALTAFADKWDAQFPTISQIWLRHWENVTPFFDYPPEIRKVIHLLFGDCEDDLQSTMRARKADFLGLRHFFEDEFKLCVLFAYDEHASTMTYRKDTFYKSFGPSEFIEWITRLTGDEARHFGNVVRLIHHKYQNRLSETPDVMQEILAL